MDCGIPFCHSGCPLGNLIPEWNDLAWRGDWRSAIERLHATNNFPEFTGRLCPAPCETACVLGINQPAVTIKQVEVTTIERAFEAQGVQPLPPERLTGKTVAVVGSGPAGLAVAQQLTRAGHTVAVYERADRPGACCATASPSSRWRRRSWIAGSPRCRPRAPDLPQRRRRRRRPHRPAVAARFDAVVLAVGSTRAARPAVPGREFDGVVQAMDFLPQANRVAVGEQVDGPDHRRPARTSSSSVAGTPAPTASAPRTGRVPGR
jgi:glutamate synthase (NADPH/NADH) small chain